MESSLALVALDLLACLGAFVASSSFKTARIDVASSLLFRANLLATQASEQPPLEICSRPAFSALPSSALLQ